MRGACIRVRAFWPYAEADYRGEAMTTKPAVPIKTATCPLCKTPRAVYHDKTGATYLTRHQNGAGWCRMSGKAVKK